MKFKGCTQISTAEMTREQWLQERKNSLGGSDIGAIIGLNKYTSPFTVWAEKRGLTDDRPDNEAMRQGRDLEQYVVERFEEQSGKKAARVNAIIRRDDFPFIHANIDRRVIGEDSGLECKTASALNASAFSGSEFPKTYYCQCVSYMAVTGFKRWYLAVVILGREFKIYRLTTVQNDPLPEWCCTSVYVSEEEKTALVDTARAFWENYVVTGNPPPTDGTDSTAETLGKLWPQSNAEMSVDLYGMDYKLQRWQEISARIKDLEAQQQEIENAIKSQMGEAERGSCDGWAVTWKTQTRKGSFDVKAFTAAHPEIDMEQYYKPATISRPFKIKEAKK